LSRVKVTTLRPVRWANAPRLATAWIILLAASPAISRPCSTPSRASKPTAHRRPPPTFLGHNTNLASKLSYDAKTATYRFNATALTLSIKNLASAGADGANPAQTGVPTPSRAQLAMQQNVGAADKKDTPALRWNLPVKAAKGITFADANAKLSFTLNAGLRHRRRPLVDGRVSLSVTGTSQQAVYSLKSNGVKEDIILADAPALQAPLTSLTPSNCPTPSRQAAAQRRRRHLLRRPGAFRPDYRQHPRRPTKNRRRPAKTRQRLPGVRAAARLSTRRESGLAARSLALPPAPGAQSSFELTGIPARQILRPGRP